MGGSREQKGRKIGKKREIKAKANQLEAKERKKGSEEKLKRKGSSMNKNQLKNMYFHGVKSTAHPPIIGTLGHSTDCIVKQPNTQT